MAIAPKFDFSGIDITNIDPDRLSMGIGVQDCSLIASTFERGAHSTPTEAAVFATFSRNIQNKKQFANAAADSLSSYLKSPAESAASTLSKSQALSANFTPTGTNATGGQTLQGLNLGDQQTTTFGQSFGSHLLDSAKNCIPCDLRLIAFLELHPDLDLLKTLEDFIKNSLSFINSLLDMLNNFDQFGDFCSLLNMLSFMCIQDLQRIIATLMALFLLKAPKLDSAIGFLQSLIAPMFAPLLMSITSLLDQFTKLVTDPLKCVVDAIDAALRTRSFIDGPPGNPNSQIGGGLVMLRNQIAEAILVIKNKVAFYVNQVKAMMGELGAGDTAYLQGKMQALTLIRMIAFVAAIISALSKGQSACSPGKTPEQSELDNFFKNFLTPQTPFNVWIDPDGNIHADEKTPVNSPTDLSPLSSNGNVVQFKGEPLVDPAVIQQITVKLTEAIHIPVPCKLETSTTDLEKLNSWIGILNGA